MHHCLRGMNALVYSNISRPLRSPVTPPQRCPVQNLRSRPQPSPELTPLAQSAKSSIKVENEPLGLQVYGALVITMIIMIPEIAPQSKSNFQNKADDTNYDDNRLNEK